MGILPVALGIVSVFAAAVPLLAAVIRGLRRASKKLDDILLDELGTPATLSGETSRKQVSGRRLRGFLVAPALLRRAGHAP
jgi:hypothetical protein